MASTSGNHVPLWPTASLASSPHALSSAAELSCRAEGRRATQSSAVSAPPAQGSSPGTAFPGGTSPPGGLPRRSVPALQPPKRLAQVHQCNAKSIICSIVTVYCFWLPVPRLNHQRSSAHAGTCLDGKCAAGAGQAAAAALHLTAVSSRGFCEWRGKLLHQRFLSRLEMYSGPEVAQCSLAYVLRAMGHMHGDFAPTWGS